MRKDIPSNVTNWEARDRLKARQEQHLTFSERKKTRPADHVVRQGSNEESVYLNQGGSMKKNHTEYEEDI